VHNEMKEIQSIEKLGADYVVGFHMEWPRKAEQHQKGNFQHVFQ
jgi:hypothetical protein